MHSSSNSTPRPTGTSARFAIWLISKLANPAYKNELVGDVQEEYALRQADGVQSAEKWLWRQAVLAILDGQKARLGHPGFISLLAVMLSLIGMFTIFVLVLWLSNMDGTTDVLWQQLLAGNVMQIALSGDFWREALPQFSAAQMDIFMFIHYPALGALVIWCAFMYITLHRFSLSSAQAWGLGFIAMCIPYIWGAAYIGLVQPEARQVGPILAFMILAPFYILPVLTGLTLAKARVERTA